MKAIHGQVANVRAIPSRQVARVELEFPIEAFGEACAEFYGKSGLLTLCNMPGGYGLVNSDEKLTPQATETPILAPPVDSKDKVGTLCQLAHILCRRADFQDWLGISPGSKDVRAIRALNKVRERCGVDTSKDLDTDNGAANSFHSYFRAPFSEGRPYAP